MKTTTVSKHKIKKLALACASIRIAHEKQGSAKERLAFIVGCEDVVIIVLTGPTGSGKSTLLGQFATEYLAELAEQMNIDCSLRPIAYCIATASGHKAFDWKSLYKAILKNLGDPFAATRQKRNDGRKPSTVLQGESAGAALLREQLEAEFIARGTSLWIIDEAQHVLRGGKSGTAGDQYGILKSLAQTAGVTLVLWPVRPAHQHVAQRAVVQAHRAHQPQSVPPDARRQEDLRLGHGLASQEAADRHELPGRQSELHLLLRPKARLPRNFQRLVDARIPACSEGRRDGDHTGVLQGNLAHPKATQGDQRGDHRGRTRVRRRRCRTRRGTGEGNHPQCNTGTPRTAPVDVVAKQPASGRGRQNKPGERTPTRDKVGGEV